MNVDMGMIGFAVLVVRVRAMVLVEATRRVLAGQLSRLKMRDRFEAGLETGEREGSQHQERKEELLGAHESLIPNPSHLEKPL